MSEEFANLLIIAGAGQNIGKTTLACQILQNEKAQKPVAVKITPHFHKTTKGLIEIQKGENWLLFEETDKTTHKDSSLYLQSGAEKSYLILAEDSGLKAAFSSLLKFLPQKNPVIIESASLIKIIKPGFFVVIFPSDEYKNEKTEALLKKADLIIISDKKQFIPSPKKISFHSFWQLK